VEGKVLISKGGPVNLKTERLPQNKIQAFFPNLAIYPRPLKTDH
jgi:hypothetical protein